MKYILQHLLKEQKRDLLNKGEKLSFSKKALYLSRNGFDLTGPDS